MLSTSLELLGLAAITAGVLVLAGPGMALLAGGAALLFVGYSAEGVEPLRATKARFAAFRAARARKNGT